MRKKNVTIKKRILKKIELNNDNYIGLTSNKMKDSDRLRIYDDRKKPIDISLYNNRLDMRTTSFERLTEIKYSKKVFVDYDIVICIPSYNRYLKIKNLLNQFYTQPTKYTFKIILLNDGSDDIRYDTLVNDFPDIIYLKNIKPNGKILHWYCYNQLWKNLKNIECHAVLQMDDDFIISEIFLDTITDMFFTEKEKNGIVMGIAPHLWSFKKFSDNESWWADKTFLDGIALIDIKIIQNMKYEMNSVDAVEVNKPGVPVRAWIQISDSIKKIGGIVYRTKNSLVYHNGNDDSKLHGDVRNNNKGGVYTQKYIGNL